jgi:hypothetical protein
LFEFDVLIYSFIISKNIKKSIMKNEYNKPTINIKNWLVSKKDIENLHVFFKNRFSTDHIEIKLTLASGNAKTYANFEEFSEDLKKIEEKKEEVSKLEISHRDSGWGDKFNFFKQLYIEIKFRDIWIPRAHIFVAAGDEDCSYKDWVAGTYDELTKMKDVFEITDKKIINILEKSYSSTIIFDPNEKIKESINEEIKRQEHQEKPNNIIILKENHKLEKEKWWDRPWFHFIIILSALATIISVVAGLK